MRIACSTAPIEKFAPLMVKLPTSVMFGLAGQGRDERVDDVVDQRGDDGGEGGAEDDGDREVDDVAAEDEVSESLEHDMSFPSPEAEGSCLRGDGTPTLVGRCVAMITRATAQPDRDRTATRNPPGLPLGPIATASARDSSAVTATTRCPRGPAADVSPPEPGRSVASTCAAVAKGAPDPAASTATVSAGRSEVNSTGSSTGRLMATDPVASRSAAEPPGTGWG